MEKKMGEGEGKEDMGQRMGRIRMSRISYHLDITGSIQLFLYLLFNRAPIHECMVGDRSSLSLGTKKIAVQFLIRTQMLGS
jgi:hypothetical protein